MTEIAASVNQDFLLSSTSEYDRKIIEKFSSTPLTRFAPVHPTGRMQCHYPLLNLPVEPQFSCRRRGESLPPGSDAGLPETVSKCVTYRKSLPRSLACSGPRVNAPWCVSSRNIHRTCKSLRDIGGKRCTMKFHGFCCYGRLVYYAVSRPMREPRIDRSYRTI